MCNSIAPGFYLTKMAEVLVELNGGVEEVTRSHPNRRLGTPDDIAGLVVFLGSRAAKHLNGAVIATDGGSVLAGAKI